MERLSGRYRVIAPDLYGYGGTGHWPAGREDLIEDEAGIALEMVERGGGRAHLVGHSYGGTVAVRAALRHPQRVLSLTLIEPTLFHLLPRVGEHEAYEEIRAVADPVLAWIAAGELEKAAERFLDYWAGAGALGRMPAQQRAAVVDSMRKLGYQWPFTLGSDFPAPADLGRIAAPTLIVRGERTTFAMRRLTEALRSLLPGSQFVEIAGAGHMSAVTHADAVNAALEGHLARHNLSLAAA
jgi:pimeloyl-ACP methyl ester carboxylesterase